MEMPGGPQDPLVPRLLPPAPPPHPGTGLLATCLTPMESRKQHQSLRPPGLRPWPLHLFICSVLRKVAQPPPPTGAWQRPQAPVPGALPPAKPPAPPHALAAQATLGWSGVALLKGRAVGVGLRLLCVL